MTSTLSLDRGAHVCHLFDGFGEQKAIVLPFLLEGLKQGDACVYVTGRQSVDDWLLELQGNGIDVQRDRQRKALTVTSGYEYRRIGNNTIVRAREVWRFIDELLVDFPSIRIAGDVAWLREPALSADQVCHWEAAANIVFHDQNVRAICQYDLKNDPPALLHSAIRTHPQVILGDELYDSPFYEAPRILANEPYLNESDADANRIAAMLRRIRIEAD